MKEDDPLLEWNRINNENLEQDYFATKAEMAEAISMNIQALNPVIDKP
jgi:hypothetical protein